MGKEGRGRPGTSDLLFPLSGKPFSHVSMAAPSARWGLVLRALPKTALLRPVPIFLYFLTLYSGCSGGPLKEVDIVALGICERDLFSRKHLV